LKRLEIGDIVEIIDISNGWSGYREAGIKIGQKGVVIEENLCGGKSHQEAFYIKIPMQCRASFPRECLKKIGEEWFR